MQITIDGEHFQFQNAADIEILPTEKAMRILQHILFVERPALIFQASNIPHLQETIRKFTAERDFFFTKAQSIEDLSVKIVQYHNENELMKKEIASLRKSVEDVTARLNETIQPISARQIATNADNAAIEAIFPLCRKKPYCLRSYINLLCFLSKPESDEFSGPEAPAAWQLLPEAKRVEIKTKADQFAAKNPYLNVSIETIKSDAWKQAHNTTTVEETLSFFQQQGDEETCEAVNVCAVFLGLTVAGAEASETDVQSN